MYAADHGNRAAGRKYTISKANVSRWRNDRASTFSSKASTKSFPESKKGRHLEVEVAVRFVKETRSKVMAVKETAKSLGINKF